MSKPKHRKIYYLLEKCDWDQLKKNPNPWDFEDIVPFTSLKAARSAAKSEDAYYGGKTVIVSFDYTVSEIGLK